MLVLSRFFAFRWAPENTFSHFHGKLRHQLIKEFDTKLIFSFINPNLGFNASSHKGAHWILFAREAGTRYMYLDGRYRTMRFFVQNYGMSDAKELKEKLQEAKEMLLRVARELAVNANTTSSNAITVVSSLAKAK